MPIDRRTIESNLLLKGFVSEENDHRYFHHEIKGKRTGAYTYTSRGTKYKTYSDELLKRMAKELRLDRLRDVKNLCLCPMNKEDYSKIIISKIKE